MPTKTDLSTSLTMIDELQGQYATAVDDRDWQQWLDLFTDDCCYAVYSLENVDQGLPLAYMLDDNRERLGDRIKFITDVWAGTVEPYRTRHVIQRLTARGRGDDTIQVRSNFVVAYTELDGPSGVLASGYYDDVVRVSGDSPRLVEKRVYLDGIPARYLIYPL